MAISCTRVPWCWSIFSSTAGSCFRKGVVLVASNFNTKDRDLLNMGYSREMDMDMFWVHDSHFLTSRYFFKWKVSKSTKGVPLWTSAYLFKWKVTPPKASACCCCFPCSFFTRSRRQLHSTLLGVRTTNDCGGWSPDGSYNNTLVHRQLPWGFCFNVYYRFSRSQTCSRNTSDSRLVCEHSARSKDLKVCQLVTWESSWWWIIFWKAPVELIFFKWCYRNSSPKNR